jgi:chromosomal replication initiator protein
MTIKGGVASQDFSAAIPAVACEPAGGVWHKVCVALKRELGDAAFGSWIAPANLREGPTGDVILVTPTGIAVTGSVAAPGVGSANCGAPTIRCRAASI